MKHGLLTADEVAALCGCSARCITRWRKRGDFPPPLRLGPRMLRWRRDVVESWLRQRGAK